MADSLLNLSFEKWGVFFTSLVPALINFGIFFYASFFLAQNKTNRNFSIFVLLLGISQIADGLMRMSLSANTAYLWNCIANSPWIFTLSFGLLFVLHFTGWHRKINYALLNMLLFVPAMLLEMLIIARIDKYEIVKSDQWNWVSNPQPTIATNLIYVWICTLALTTFVLLWLSYFKKRDKQPRRMQSLLLAVGFTIPFVGGIIFEVIFPLVFRTDSIPLTTPLITAFSISVFVAIKKYRLFDYSPKHQWQQILETMNEGMLIVDNDDRVMYANQNFCKLMEYDFSEIKGKVAHELFIENTEDKKQIVKAIIERKNKKSSNYEVLLKTKSGKKIWMLMNGSPYLDRNGNAIGSIGIQTNIDHLKKVEEKLLNSNRELETYIYKASHDLKAPLSSIRGLIQICKMEVDDKLAIKYFSLIDTMVEKLDYTLLSLIKTMAIKDVQKFDEEINFENLIQENLNKFRYTPEFSRLKIYTSISLSAPFYSNTFILDTIFQNLFENSIKYQSPNQEESYLRINISKNEKQLVIIVEDNGMGIEKSVQSKIFDMYYRGNEQSKGSGLGLYLVKKGVEKLNGKIQANSTLGKGTSFKILLDFHSLYQN